MHPKVRNIPRNTQLRGRLFDKWPRKGLSGACCAPSGEVSGAPTGRGPACSEMKPGAVQVVLRRSPGAEPACSAVQTGRTAHNRPGPPKAAAGPACSAARDGAVQVVLRWSPGRTVHNRPGSPKAAAEPACSAVRDGRAGGGCGERRGTKKNGPRSVHFYSTTLLLYGLLLREARPMPQPHNNGSALREPVSFAGDFRQHVLLQQPVCLRFRPARRSGSQPLAARSSNLRRRPGRTRESLRRPGLSRPPPGSQFTAARGLGLRCSPPPPGPHP